MTYSLHKYNYRCILAGCQMINKYNYFVMISSFIFTLIQHVRSCTLINSTTFFIQMLIHLQDQLVKAVS